MQMVNTRLHDPNLTHLRYTDAVLIHPAQIPHGERTHLRVRGGLIVPSRLLPAHRFGLFWYAKTVVVVVAHFD